MESVYFRRLNVGDHFRFNKQLFIKIREYYDGHHDSNCVNLHTGDLDYVSYQEAVVLDPWLKERL